MLQIKDLKGKKPHFTKNGNIKLGNKMWVWSTMKGSDKEKRYINDFGGECSGTCGKYCTECSKECYVNRSYRYGSVLKGHAVNTVWIKENPSKTFELLDKQLERAKIKPQYIRVNQSGEIQSGEELMRWIKLADKYRDIKFYVYTKNYDAIKEIENKNILQNMRDNLIILLSIWHDKGIKEYQQYKQYKNIKAFVYDDGDIRLKPDTYCMAYNAKGKLNHNVTCEKCKKCFDQKNEHKIIACKSH